MGKASSNKKVARAARAGGNLRTTDRRKLGFPSAILAVIVVGIALVFVARETRDTQVVAPEINKDHWHDAYGVYICDAYIPPLLDAEEDILGIHTHEDGLMHIHPFSSNAAGKKAKLGVFADMVHLELEDDSIKLPDGTEYKDGDKCPDGEKGELRVLRWKPEDLPDGDPQVISTDFDDVRMRENGEAFAFVFAPKDADIPPPPSIDTQPTDVPGAETATTGGGSTPSTVTGEPSDTTTPASTPTTTGAPTSAPTTVP